MDLLQDAIDLPSVETHETHPVLSIVCRKGRLYIIAHMLGAVLLYVVAVGCTIFWFVARSTSVELSAGLEGFVMFAWGLPTMMLFYFIYAEPNLVLTEKGITVQFIVKEYHIAWEDVVKIRPGDRFSNAHIFVRNLTIFNRIWGLLSFHWRPAFAVSRNFSEYNEIVEFIKYKTH